MRLRACLCVLCAVATSRTASSRFGLYKCMSKFFDFEFFWPGLAQSEWCLCICLCVWFGGSMIDVRARFLLMLVL